MAKFIKIKWSDLNTNPALAAGLEFVSRSSGTKVNNYRRPVVADAPSPEVAETPKAKGSTKKKKETN